MILINTILGSLRSTKRHVLKTGPVNEEKNTSKLQLRKKEKKKKKKAKRIHFRERPECSFLPACRRPAGPSYLLKRVTGDLPPPAACPGSMCPGIRRQHSTRSRLRQDEISVRFAAHLCARQCQRMTAAVYNAVGVFLGWPGSSGAASCTFGRRRGIPLA